MGAIYVDPRQLEVVLGTVRKIRKGLPASVLYGVEDALGLVAGEARNLMGVDTGALHDSLWEGITRVDADAGIVQGKVTMQAPGKQQLPYAWMEEEGGWIVPRPENKRQLLVWREGSTGQLVFASRVYHKGKHYMKNGLANTQAEARAMIGGAMVNHPPILEDS